MSNILEVGSGAIWIDQYLWEYPVCSSTARFPVLLFELTVDGLARKPHPLYPRFMLLMMMVSWNSSQQSSNNHQKTGSSWELRRWTARWGRTPPSKFHRRAVHLRLVLSWLYTAHLPNRVAHRESHSIFLVVIAQHLNLQSRQRVANFEASDVHHHPELISLQATCSYLVGINQFV